MQERDPIPKAQEPAIKAITIGTEVEFCGGRFRVHSYGRKFIKLEAMPGCIILDKKRGK